MSYELSDRLVVGVASSALFDLTESDAYFREHGELAYRQYQDEHIAQDQHLTGAAEHIAGVHIPYGIANEQGSDA